MPGDCGSRSERPPARRTGRSALVGAGILGMLALVNSRRARLAEQHHPPEGDFLNIGEVRLHYLERGGGPPVVLLHGNGATIEDFAISGILDRLAEC